MNIKFGIENYYNITASRPILNIVITRLEDRIQNIKYLV